MSTSGGSGSNCACSSASARSSSSPFLNARPCQPSLPSTNDTPLPLMVPATIIVGWPFTVRASAYASRTAFKSWPSMTMACQPKARQRRANWSRSWPPSVGPALSEAVDVGHGAEIVEAIHRGDVRRFPDRAFRGFSVAEQAVGPVVGLDAARVERAADRRADALAERTGGDVDKREPRRGVA